MTRILVIKLGALGDFVHAFHAFAAIRAHHPESAVTLMTTAPFRALGESAPWFDGVLLDVRAPWWQWWTHYRSAASIRGYDFVYDLQTSGRSNRYFRLAGRPPWSGIADGCSHPHRNPHRDFMHTIERQREQLAAAGVTRWPAPDRVWLIARGRRPAIAGPYALLMPGSSGRGMIKRWPIDRYVEVARRLAERGLTPVVIGGATEAPLGRIIVTACPAAVDLTGRTSIEDVAALAAGAAVVLGNDTGPVHLAASVGAPTVVLFSAAGVPAQAAPRGPDGEWVAIEQSADLKDLGVDRVLTAVWRELAGRSESSAARENVESLADRIENPLRPSRDIEPEALSRGPPLRPTQS